MVATWNLDSYTRQITPRVVARPREQGATTAPAVDQAGEQIPARLPDVGVALGADESSGSHNPSGHRSYQVPRLAVEGRVHTAESGLRVSYRLGRRRVRAARSSETTTAPCAVSAHQEPPDALGTPWAFQSSAIVMRPSPSSTRRAASRPNSRSSSLATPQPSWPAGLCASQSARWRSTPARWPLGSEEILV